RTPSSGSTSCTRPRAGSTAAGWSACASFRLSNGFQARVGAILAPDLRARPAVVHHHVGGEVVGAADQRGADAVGVDGHAVLLELADALGVEAAGDDDADLAEACLVELGAR